MKSAYTTPPAPACGGLLPAEIFRRFEAFAESSCRNGAQEWTEGRVLAILSTPLDLTPWLNYLLESQLWNTPETRRCDRSGAPAENTTCPTRSLPTPYVRLHTNLSTILDSYTSDDCGWGGWPSDEHAKEMWRSTMVSTHTISVPFTGYQLPLDTAYLLCLARRWFPSCTCLNQGRRHTMRGKSCSVLTSNLKSNPVFRQRLIRYRVFDETWSKRDNVQHLNVKLDTTPEAKHRRHLGLRTHRRHQFWTPSIGATLSTSENQQHCSTWLDSSQTILP